MRNMKWNRPLACCHQSCTEFACIFSFIYLLYVARKCNINVNILFTGNKSGGAFSWKTRLLWLWRLIFLILRSRRSSWNWRETVAVNFNQKRRKFSIHLYVFFYILSGYASFASIFYPATTKNLIKNFIKAMACRCLTKGYNSFTPLQKTGYDQALSKRLRWSCIQNYTYNIH